MVGVAHLHDFALVNLERIRDFAAIPCTGAAECSYRESGFKLIVIAGSAAAGLNVIDDVLLHVVAFRARRAADAAGAGIENGKLEVAVAHSTPTPVDVEVVAILITVANERVSAAAACSTIIDHGAACCEFAIHHVVPHFLSVVVAVSQIRTIAKDAECIGNVVGVSTRSRCAILRLECAAHIEHEVGHSVGVYLIFSTGVAVLHVSPVESDGVECGHVYSNIVVVAGIVGEGISGNGGSGIGWILVIVHDL